MISAMATTYRFAVFRHNAYGEWGPPPDDATTVIMVGEADQDQLQRWFDGTCGLAAQVTSPPGVENEESDASIRVCRLGELDWTKLWPEVRRLG